MLAKPAVGWSVAGIAILVAALIFWRSVTSRDSYDISRLSQTVTVRFTDTNNEIKLTRAEFEKQLRALPGTLSTSSGIINPKTGKPTGILVATADWEEVVNRINGERTWAQENSPFGSAPPKPAGTDKPR